MSNEDLTSVKEEIYSSIRDLENKLLKILNTKIAEISDNFEKYNEKIDSITSNNRQIVESVISEKISLEKLNALESFKNKADGILISHEIRINNDNKDINQMRNKYDRVIEDNLLVPGLIGAKCQFTNVKEYIMSINSEISRLKYEKDQLKKETKDYKSRIDNLFKQMISVADNSVDRSKEYIDSQLLGNKNQFEKKIDEYSQNAHNLRIEIFKIKSDIEEQANNIKLEAEKINNFSEKSNNIDENIVKINDKIADMTLKTNYEINNLHEKNKKTEKKVIDLKNELGRIKVMSEIRNKSKSILNNSKIKEIMENSHTMANKRNSCSNIESFDNKNFSEKKNFNEKNKKYFDIKGKKSFCFGINSLTKEETELKNNINIIKKNKKIKNEEKISSIKLNKIKKKIKNSNNNNEEEKTDIIISEESFQDNDNINEDDISNINHFYKTIIDSNRTKRISSRNEDIININPNFKESVDNTNNNFQNNFNTFKEPEKPKRIGQIKFDLKTKSLKKKTYSIATGENKLFPKIYLQSNSTNIDNQANQEFLNNHNDNNTIINIDNNNNNENNDNNDNAHSSASESINNNNNKEMKMKENKENKEKKIKSLEIQNEIDNSNMSSRKESVKNLKETTDNLNNSPSYKNNQKIYSRNNNYLFYNSSYNNNNNKNSYNTSPKAFDEDKYLLTNFKKNKKRMSFSKSNKNNYINNMNYNHINNNNQKQIILSQKNSSGGINIIGINEEKLNKKYSIEGNIYLDQENENNLKLENINLPSTKSVKIKKKKNKLQGISCEVPLKISAAFGRTAYTFIDKNNNKKFYSIKMLKKKPENEKFDVYLGNSNNL